MAMFPFTAVHLPRRQNRGFKAHASPGMGCHMFILKSYAFDPILQIGGGVLEVLASPAHGRDVDQR